jgi:predicted nuclease of predicted toxin-antitoxin system
VKFIVDAQLPPALASWLRERGHDAASVREIGLREADDKSIWSRAQSANAIIVTKDEDFALLATALPAVRVLWVRIGNVINRVLLARFDQAWPEIVTHLEEGARIVEVR